jgi:hypothetical protein
VTTIEKIELFNGENQIAPLTEISNLLMGLTKDTFEISIERLIKGNRSGQILTLQYCVLLPTTFI